MFNVEQIVTSVSLVELAQKAGTTLKFAHGSWRGACPLHGGNNNTAFVISNKDGKELWNCFTDDCGGGDVIDFVKAWRGWDFKQACEFLGGDVHADPVEMERLARVRLETAQVKLEEQKRRVEAARKELQVAEKHLFYHQSMGAWARALWLERGLDEGMQDFFTLGACNDFEINNGYHTPTLTIPIVDEKRVLLNIQHRLVNPPTPGDRYRPETWGLGSLPPFLAVPEMGYDGELIVVVEGAIKAMVTWAHLDIPECQLIGVTSKNAFTKVSENLKGKNVLVIPDPNGEKEAVELAKSVNGRILNLPAKVDDFLLATKITSNAFYEMTRMARLA